MDSKNLKFIFFIVVLILDYGHLRDSPVAGCLTSSDCSYGQYCDDYLCKREVIVQQDYPSYSRGEIPRRISDSEYYSSNYQGAFDNRDDIRLGQPDNSEWYAAESDYDRRTEGQKLGPFFPVEDLRQERRVFDTGSLPPVGAENWNQIGTKHGTNREYSQDEYKSLADNYNSLKAPKHIRQREDSSSKSAQSVGYRRDSSKNKNEFVNKSLKDSIGDNEDLASKKSEILKSEDDIRSFSVESEKKIPAVPLTSEIAPDHDNSGLQDSRMQTEKQAEGRKEEGKVMVKGKVKKVNADIVIDQGPNPEKTYKRVEDFFQSQRESSIVEVPNSVKKEEESKLYKDNFVPVKDDASDHVSKEQDSYGGDWIRVPVLHKDPHSWKEHTELHKITKFGVNRANIEHDTALYKLEHFTKKCLDYQTHCPEPVAELWRKQRADSDLLKEGNIKLSLNQNVTAAQAKIVAAALQNALWNNAPSPMFIVSKVDNAEVKLKMAQTPYTLEEPRGVAERIEKEPNVKDEVARSSGLEIKAADFEDTSSKNVKTGQPKTSVETQQPKYFLITIIVVGCVTGVVLTAVAIYLMMRRHQEAKSFKPVTLPGQEAAADYQELCRQLRATQGWDSAPVKTMPTQPTAEKEKGLASGRAPKYSWSEEPVVPNMDISTGHVVLAYMEDHLKNKDRLNKEWEALKTYEAEPNSREVGKLEKNNRKNRYGDVLPYDHNRVLLKETASATGSDYINASYIMDHDPKNPSYIATQGPLAQTVSDFWQMVWEQGVVVIVNLTKLSDLGLPQCHRYWPEEQQPIVTYRIYEVHLVSEHIWCEDYLVRSFYLKNLQTSETRTVTQFHFLTWPDLNVPATPKPLLEFRRKVNKCFRGRASPVVVHCSGGVGRTGTYILIDMVLNKMMRGAKEIDIAATVEHLRDQRPSMVKTKAQFEFALTAVAEEVNAILQALAK